MLETSKYIHLNPVRANMVKMPQEYKWSSYNALIGSCDEKIEDKNILLSYFKDKNCELYRSYVEEEIKIYENSI